MERLVTSTPLAHLWRGTVAVDATRVEVVDADRIREILRSSDAPLVIASINEPLRWIESTTRFAAEKDEIQPRLVRANTDRIRLEDSPDGRCYVASAWQNGTELITILLEEYH